MKQQLRFLLLALLSVSRLTAAEGTEKDTSGTNPTLLLRSLNLSDEYSELQTGDYLNNFSLKYTEPFMDG